MVLCMKRVLVIFDDSDLDSCSQPYPQFDSSIHITEVAARQINTKRLNKSLRILRKIDIILLQEAALSVQAHTHRLLTFLESTGIPIMLLPSLEKLVASDWQPKLLNWQEQNPSSPELTLLIQKIHSYYTTHRTEDIAAGSALSLSIISDRPSQRNSPKPKTPNSYSLPPSASPPLTDSKVQTTLTAVRRIAGQLREPLANMNLAIHMLKRTHSAAEQERYLQLLREEYNRELQLLNQLDNYLQTNDFSFLPGSTQERV